MNGYTCLKCKKELSTKYRLQQHLLKGLPCDLTCRDCSFKAKDRHQFYRHRKAEHPIKKERTEKDEDHPIAPTPVALAAPIAPVDPVALVTPVAPVAQPMEIEEYIPQSAPRNRVRLPGDPPRNNTRIIPIQDFDPECLRELAALANKEDVEIVFERVTIKPLKRRRAEEAIKNFQTSDYAQSLRCLDRDVVSVAAEILSRFHGDPRRPQLHAIRMGDISRKMVNIHCRPVVEEDSRWLSFAKEPTLTTLSGHTSAILRFMLERASDLLQYKLCVKEKVVCFCLHDAEQNKNLIIVDENEFDSLNDADILVSLGYAPRLKVMFYDDELTEIVHGFGYTGKARDLGLLINQKTGEVLQQLKTLSFKESDIMGFLERTRRPFVLSTNANEVD